MVLSRIVPTADTVHFSIHPTQIPTRTGATTTATTTDPPTTTMGAVVPATPLPAERSRPKDEDRILRFHRVGADRL